MSQADKKLQAMSTNPRNDWKISDLQSIANRYGIVYRQPGTSHVTFSSPDGTMLTVPAHKPIKPVYIKKFVEMIKALNEENIP
ncbi:MAG: hypothetical protein ACOH2E_04850 [Candidatus Paracaedibacter sp.]